MLRNLKDLKGFIVRAIDGDLGVVKDFHFDIENWVMQHLIMETGSWYASRKVLLSPSKIDYLNIESKIFFVALTKEKIMSTCSLDTGDSVSGYYERKYLDSPCNIGVAEVWDLRVSPGLMGDERVVPSKNVFDETIFATSARKSKHNNKVRNCETIIGCHIEAIDGDVGYIDGILIEDENWSIRYFIIDTSNWWLGHQLIIQPQWIKKMTGVNPSVSVSLMQNEIKNAHRYDSKGSFNHDMETRVHLYFGPKS